MAEDGPIDFEDLNDEKAKLIGRQLDAASRCGLGTLRHRLTAEKIDGLFKRATKLLKIEPTVIDLTLSDPEIQITVVGDTHGQLHDVLNMFSVTGYPNQSSVFVLNGDFVDRGSWGLETLILFVCWKLTFPQKVFLIRGNHESAFTTQLYGYKAELEAKYNRSQNRTIYASSKRLFAVMPLAIVIQSKTLICHGGLFRATKRKRKKSETGLQLGDLSMLRLCSKGGLEPSEAKVAKTITDVLWSDPTMESGLKENDVRGLGLIFGPDITDRFLEANGLELIIRSHEGPDARMDRDGMNDMMTGFAIDHETPHGKLITVFSAPDYPQHQVSPTRINNSGAVVILKGPNYTTPFPLHFDAVQGRPLAPVFYDLEEHAETDGDFEEIIQTEALLFRTESEPLPYDDSDISNPKQSKTDPSWTPSDEEWD